MKYLTITLNQNATIAIDNDFTGKETITYNQKTVSSIRSISGGTHKFEVEELGEKVKYEVKISFNLMTGIGMEIRRNEMEVFNNNPKMELNSKAWLNATSIIGLFLCAFFIITGIVKENHDYTPLAVVLACCSYVLYYYTKTSPKDQPN